MSKVRFEGVMAALPTPLTDNGEIKVATVKKLVDHSLDEGLHGFYVTGATGEGVALSAKKREIMVNAVIEANAGRGKVIVHIGAIDPYEAMALTRQATAVGADGVSAMPPNYMFEYDADEIVDYYTRLAGETNLPLLLYATPKTVALDINGIIERLLAVPNIVGAKDTRANYYKMWQLKQLNGGDVNVINGPDQMLICGLTMGADGGIGGTYSVMPRWFAELYKSFRSGKIDEAEEWGDLGHIIRLTANGRRIREPEKDSCLYLAEEEPMPVEEVRLSFIPYYTWANRGSNDMCVWIRTISNT